MNKMDSYIGIGIGIGYARLLLFQFRCWERLRLLSGPVARSFDILVQLHIKKEKR